MQAEAQPPHLTDANTLIARVALYVLLIILAIAILFPLLLDGGDIAQNESRSLLLSAGLLPP